MIIGITGTSCSGKHSFAESLQKACEGEIINADTLAHELYMPGTEAYTEIVKNFGEEILAENKTINRQRLGDIVWQDKEHLQLLNDIVHPRLQTILKEILQNKSKEKPILVIAALLKELDLRVDYLIVVSCALKNKIPRAEKKEVSVERLNKILKIQEENEDYDFIVHNDFGFDHLEKEAQTIWTKIKTDQKIADYD